MIDILPDVINKVQNKLNPQNSLSHDFTGQCGAAQSILFYAFADLGIKYKPFASQSLENYFFGHAAGIISDDKGKHYLIDPTFTQFATNKNQEQPSDILRKSDEGCKLLEELLKKYFFEVTKDTAYLYLQSFLNKQKVNISKDEAYQFLINPPQHEYHLTYASDDRKATRTSLKNDGFLLEL